MRENQIIILNSLSTWNLVYIIEMVEATEHEQIKSVVRIRMCICWKCEYNLENFNFLSIYNISESFHFPFKFLSLISYIFLYVFFYAGQDDFMKSKYIIIKEYAFFLLNFLRKVLLLYLSNSVPSEHSSCVHAFIKLVFSPHLYLFTLRVGWARRDERLRTLLSCNI